MRGLPVEVELAGSRRMAFREDEKDESDAGDISLAVIPRAFGEAGAGHALAQAAVLHRGLLQLAERC
jgi:hypothetical protein